ncbi:MAG: hypothetical protein IPP72_16310 [Chitinophagaceae bacterium]|nr:hypothetical protein [Chitinophagaceae bacterium]
MPSAFVSCLYQDSERNIWIGTALGLAKLVTKTSISVYTTDDGSISKVFSLLVPLAKDLFMTRTETGLHVFDSKKRLFSPVRSVHQFPYSDYIKNTRPVLFYTDNKSLGKFDTTKRVITDSVLPGLPTKLIYCSVMDSSGIIFTGTETGLVVRFKNGSSAGINSLS